MLGETLNRLSAFAQDIKAAIGWLMVMVGINTATAMGWLESNVPWISASLLTLSLALVNFRTAKLREEEAKKIELERKKIEKELQDE